MRKEENSTLSLRWLDGESLSSEHHQMSPMESLSEANNRKRFTKRHRDTPSTFKACIVLSAYLLDCLFKSNT